jgi:hypothetical protein
MSAPLKLSARARVPVKEVHRALTDAAAPRIWLARVRRGRPAPPVRVRGQ